MMPNLSMAAKSVTTASDGEAGKRRWHKRHLECLRRTGRNSNTPTGPFHSMVLAFMMIVSQGAWQKSGPMSKDHVTVGRVSDGLDSGQVDSENSVPTTTSVVTRECWSRQPASWRCRSGRARTGDFADVADRQRR